MRNKLLRRVIFRDGVSRKDLRSVFRSMKDSGDWFSGCTGKYSFLL